MVRSETSADNRCCELLHMHPDETQAQPESLLRGPLLCQLHGNQEEKAQLHNPGSVGENHNRALLNWACPSWKMSPM
eukprot:988077-Amphidinium_carterae.1